MIKVNPYPGLFIDIEGLDGSGATTQVGLVARSLRGQKLRVYTTKEPTDNVIGGLIRGALTGVYKLSHSSLQLLFVADREHHLQREIIPILQNSSVLISDRYLWSTIAYGSVELSKRWLLELHHYCPIPDLTFLIRVSPNVCLERIKKERFGFELFEEKQKLFKAWDTYLWLQKKFSESIYIVNGEQSKEKTKKDILKIVWKHPKFKHLKK